MAWTTLPTYATGDALTAAQLNAIKDNINESAVAKATAANRWIVPNGTNTLVERVISAVEVLTQETTTSTSYANLTTTGPEVTATTGTRAIVSFSCQMFNSGATSSNWSGFAVSGATTTAANDQHAISCEAASATQAFKIGATFLETLTAGSNTFTQKYRVGSNTGTFDDRHMLVMAL